MKRHLRVTRAVPKGGAISLQALLEDGTSLWIDVPVRAGEPCPEFRARAEAAMRVAVVEIDTMGHRAAHYAHACEGVEITLEPPEPCEASVNGDLLEGWVGVGTRCLLVTLREGGVEREAPNKNGRFSVALGGRTALRLCPVSHDGLCGDERTL